MNSHVVPAMPTLLDQLLEEQGELTAVERFARAHEGLSDVPAQARQYRALIPLAQPRPGEQYGFSVDLDSCTGCQACVSACHSLNGLDEDETWRSTGLLLGGTVAKPYQQVVTTACHHCVEPACLDGCPVLAYEKDPVTGIVRHLDDQCIGCQYCVLKCPYDVPQYSGKRGIVRKCDMCHGRLAANEAPACVQACPSSAISIRIVSRTETAGACANPEHRLLPGTAPSSYTLPTTTYTSSRTPPENARPADSETLRTEPAHWPLIWMLLLTQAAAGATVLTSFLSMRRSGWPSVAESSSALLSAMLLVGGLLSSVFHLGRPGGAWRAFLGWRRSWMSREILAFGGYAGVSIAWTAAAWLGWSDETVAALRASAGAFALIAVFCSAMIYVDTRRSFWKGWNTFPRFFGAAFLLGASAVAVLLSALSFFVGSDVLGEARTAGLVATLIRIVLFVWDGTELARRLSNPDAVNHRSAVVIWRRHRGLVWTWVALFGVSTVCNVLALSAGGGTAAVMSVVALLATFASSVIERYFFFVAVIRSKMPGGVVG